VRILRLEVGAFGRLSQLATTGEDLGSLVVVVGPNEAGKSSLFHFLTSMLYGFTPATRDTHPYAPWSGEDPSGSVTLTLSTGESVEVHRRLLSQPRGHLVRGGEHEDLRNRAIPWVEHVPREVFRQVFALTLSDMASLEGSTWSTVQDRLLGSMGASDLRPARAVAIELDAEAGRLWRPTRHGNQTIRELQKEAGELRRRRGEAARRDADLRRLVDELAEARNVLGELRAAHTTTHLSLERIRTLGPVRRDLMRMEDLAGQAGPAGELEGLPADPRGHLAELDSEIAATRERARRLESELEGPVHTLTTLDAETTRVLEMEGDIRGFISAAASVGPLRNRILSLEQEMRDLERRLDAVGSRFLHRPWREVDHDLLLGIAPAELKERVVRYLQEADRLRTLEEATGREFDTRPRAAPLASPLGSAAFILLGGGLVWRGLSTGDITLASFGGIAILLGAFFVVQGMAIARHGNDRSEEHRQRHVETRTSGVRLGVDRARLEVVTLLAAIPVIPIYLEGPTDALVSALESTHDLLRDRAERADSLESLTAEMAGLDSRARALAAKLGDDPPEDAAGMALRLDHDLREAERARAGAASAEREAERIRSELSAAEAAGAALVERRTRIAEALRPLGDGDEAAGLAVAEARLEARERARRLAQEMEHRHPDLADMKERIAAAEAAGEEWTADEDTQVRLSIRLEELADEMAAAATRAADLEGEIRQLRREETADAVDGAIASLRDREARLIRERDRAWILAHAVRTADREFREEHQPDVFRRAGAYLESLTQGRYNRILLSDSVDEEHFMVMGPSLEGPLRLAPPISTGTLEQAYLALRLAIVDHLDAGGERLPLFIDEVFVNWDDTRREGGFDILSGLSETRQLFVFTCHAEMAHRLGERGATVVTLEAER